MNIKKIISWFSLRKDIFPENKTQILKAIATACAAKYF